MSSISVVSDHITTESGQSVVTRASGLPIQPTHQPTLLATTESSTVESSGDIAGTSADWKVIYLPVAGGAVILVLVVLVVTSCICRYCQNRTGKFESTRYNCVITFCSIQISSLLFQFQLTAAITAVANPVFRYEAMSSY